MLKLGPPSKESDNFSKHWLGIGGTMIVELYLMSRNCTIDSPLVRQRQRDAEAERGGLRPRSPRGRYFTSLLSCHLCLNYISCTLYS